MDRTWNFLWNLVRLRRSCLHTSLSLQGSFFLNFSLGKTEDFHTLAFLDFSGNYILYFPCIQNKYWLFVIQKFEVIHLFIGFSLHNFLYINNTCDLICLQINKEKRSSIDLDIHNSKVSVKVTLFVYIKPLLL